MILSQLCTALHFKSVCEELSKSVWNASAEAQQYRERIRKAKLHVYEQYLWRKDLMADYNKQIDYMRSPQWDAIFSQKIQRCALL